LLVCLIAATVGCAVGMERRVVEMMRKTPENAMAFSFQDIEALRGDNDLKGLIEEWNWRGYFEEAFEKYGIYFDDVNRTARGTVLGSGSYYLIDGNSDLDEVRNKLDALGFDKDEYRDVEVWVRTARSVALMEDIIVFGFGQVVRDCIDVIKGEKDSLWHNQDARDVVDRLPDGISLTYLLIPYQESMMTEEPPWKAQGASLEKKDEDTLKSTQVFMFENEDAACDFAEEEDERRNVKQDGKFVIVPDEVDIKELFTYFSLEASPASPPLDRTFSHVATTTIGGDDPAHQQISYRITIANIRAEVASNVRVTLSTMATNRESESVMMETEPSTLGLINLELGESETYYITWEYDASNTSKEELARLVSLTTILVKYTTQEGEEVEELLFSVSGEPYPSKSPPSE